MLRIDSTPERGARPGGFPLKKETMGAIATKDLSRLRAVVGGKDEQTARPQPVCIEVPVTMHGVRLSADSGKREPFTEFTRTLLVFSNGAVLRLRTAVNPGQLITLINEHTRKVVVCQVVKSMTCQNVAGYIELKFTEPTFGFWGILFPGDQSESQSTPAASGVSQEPPRPQPLLSAAPHKTLLVVSPHATATDSINAGLLSQKAAAAEHPAAAPASVSTPFAKPPAPPHPELIESKVAPLSDAEKHASVAEPPVFSRTREAATSASTAAEPLDDDEIAAFISRLMFEEPETESAQATTRRSAVIVLIAAELLLSGLVGGWYWWRHRAHESAANLSPQSAANAATSMGVLPPANAQTAPSVSSPVPEALKTVEASSLPPALAEKPAENHESPNAASKKSAAISDFRLSRPHAKRTAFPANNPEAAVGIDSAPEISSPVSTEGLSTLVGGSGLQPAAPKPERPIGGEVKTARLVSSAPLAYPPLARSQRVEGDVTLDALIDKTGRVTTIKVISGPDLLRQAAVDAVRQWKYVPATLDGKAVPMHLSVAVKFRLP